MTSFWKAAQCGQVMEAYSTIVTGASLEPCTMSVGFISTFDPPLALASVELDWMHPARASAKRTDATAPRARDFVFMGGFPWSFTSVLAERRSWFNRPLQSGDSIRALSKLLFREPVRRLFL